MSLNSLVTSGIKPEPPLVLIYGPEGKGKSTYGSTFPSPIILDTEGKIGHIQAAKLPVPKNTEEVLQFLYMILNEDHEYKTLVIDSVDGLDKIFCDTICRANNAKEILDTHIKALSFGGGYRMVRQQWGTILDLLLSIHKKRKMIISLIGHASVYNFEDPENAPYDRYTLKMHSNGKDCTTAQMIFEWVNVIGFIHEKRQVVKEDVGFNRDVKRVQGSGLHTLALEHRPAYIAKNHYNLPAEIGWSNPPHWEELGGLIKDFWRSKLNKDKDGGNNNGQQRDQQQQQQEQSPRPNNINSQDGRDDNLSGDREVPGESGHNRESGNALKSSIHDEGGRKQSRGSSKDSKSADKKAGGKSEALDEAIKLLKEGD